MIRLSPLVTALAVIIPCVAGAQPRLAVPIRPLGKIVRSSGDSLTNISDIRVFADGRVMANDNIGRRVVLFDSALSHYTIVADTTSSTAKAYGTRPGRLLAYRADTTIYVDWASTSFLMIDPKGKIDHVVAPPRPTDIVYYSIPTYGATFDGVSSLIYRLPGKSKPAPNGGVTLPDSSPLVRANVATKAYDTVAMLRLPVSPLVSVPCGDNCFNFRTVLAPFRVADDWSVMANGTVVVARSNDYHLDLIAPDGTRSSTAKVNHEWIRLTDIDKDSLIDSIRRVDSTSRAFEDSVTAVQRAAGRAGGIGVIRGETPVGGGPTGPLYVSADELADYRPPFYATTIPYMRVDGAGRIWVRTLLSVPTPEGGLVYDIVDARGTLIDRVQLPKGVGLAGFGPGDIVYVTSRTGNGVHLARALFR